MAEKEVNKQIVRCGLVYIGHFGVTEFQVLGDSFRITIPIKRIREFVKLFPEIDWENGTFLEDMSRKYIRLVTDDGFNIIASRKPCRDDNKGSISNPARCFGWRVYL